MSTKSAPKELSPVKRSSSPAKKPYRAPQLVAYGDIREITRANALPQINGDGVTPPRGMELKTGGSV